MHLPFLLRRLLPILQREVVEKKGWATEEELTDYFAIGQCTPGVIAVNTATFIGYKYKKYAGAVLASLGVVFPSIVIIIYNFIATFLVILRYDWFMAVLAFIGAPFGFAMSAILMKKRRAYAKRAQEMGSEIMSFQMETFYNFDTIKSFGITQYYSDKLRWWQRKSNNFALEMNMFNIKTGIIGSIFGTITQGIVFGYCLWRLWTRDITYGTMTLFLQQRSKLAGAFSSLVAIIPGFLNSSISAHRIRELVDLPREKHVPQSGELDQFAQDGFTIEMRDLSFSYVRGQRVIRHSDLVAKPG